MITTLEDLSNEILLQVFEHLAVPTDVHGAFCNLNHRFDVLLRSVRLPLDIFVEDEQSSTMIRCFASFCIRLRVHNLCPSISLRHFPQLRSLTITEPTDAQLRSIHPSTLPLLEYLHSPAAMVSLQRFLRRSSLHEMLHRRSSTLSSPTNTIGGHIFAHATSISRISHPRKSLGKPINSFARYTA